MQNRERGGEDRGRLCQCKRFYYYVCPAHVHWHTHAMAFHSTAEPKRNLGMCDTSYRESYRLTPEEEYTYTATTHTHTHTHTHRDALEHKTLLNACRTALHCADGPAWYQQRQRQTEMCETKQRKWQLSVWLTGPSFDFGCNYWRGAGGGLGWGNTGIQ